MCGRLIQHSPSSAYAELFGVEADLVEIPPRYNLAPHSRRWWRAPPRVASGISPS